MPQGSERPTVWPPLLGVLERLGLGVVLCWMAAQEAELHALRDELKGLHEREAAWMAAMRAEASHEEAVAAEEEGGGDDDEHSGGGGKPVTLLLLYVFPGTVSHLVSYLALLTVATIEM